MLLKYFYDDALAHASYLVGCAKGKVAVVVDPGRDVQQYLDLAQKEDLKIVAVAETHIHADYVSGARELAELVGAKLYLSDEGPAEWKYSYASQYDAELVREGDRFQIGNILFEVLHTPGHTPESVSFLLTDLGGGATQPMGIFTGDFVFVGSIGRPDLLEEAAGISGSARAGALQLFESAKRFKTLPDYLQIWPAHGAGSACGKGLGAIPSSTVGYEKRFNPALQFADDQRDAFVEYILSDQPEAPKYFAVMKRVNKEGPALIADIETPSNLDAVRVKEVVSEATLIDVTSSEHFANGHVPGAINIPTSMLAAWAGWVVDYQRPVYLVADEPDVAEAVRVLRKIGLDDLRGVFSPNELKQAGLATQNYSSLTPLEAVRRLEAQEVELVDVRSDAEWEAGHIAQAHHHFLGRLPERIQDLSQDKPLVVQCQSGARSAIAASILQAAGKDVYDMQGGFAAYQAS